MTDEEFLQNEIQKYKEQYRVLLEDEANLENAKQQSESLANQLHEKGDKLEKRILQQEQDLNNKEEIYQANVESMGEENKRLEKQGREMEDKIAQLKKETDKLNVVSASGTERKMVFKGKFIKFIPENGLKIKHQILYPVEGGTALITFEKEEVASALIQNKKIEVMMTEECRIIVNVEPVELLVLDALSVDMSLSTKKILVSRLPNSLSEDVLLDKLELFFSKPRNSGGEVESREYLSDSSNVILTFNHEEVVPHLTEIKHFYVPFGEFNQKVCVTPSLDGNIKNFKMKNYVCNRTVLITGIPDIMDAQNLKDLLEIFFQKNSIGGGEVEDLVYTPEGQCALAVFQGDDDDDDDED
ncbi:interferon-induced 35 kDa protein [Rhinophrynus dorsalis]